MMPYEILYFVIPNAKYQRKRHSRESDYMGFWGQKNSSGACAPLCHADFALALFSFFILVFCIIIL